MRLTCFTPRRKRKSRAENIVFGWGTRPVTIWPRPAYRASFTMAGCSAAKFIFPFRHDPNLSATRPSLIWAFPQLHFQSAYERLGTRSAGDMKKDEVSQGINPLVLSSFPRAARTNCAKLGDLEFILSQFRNPAVSLKSRCQQGHAFFTR